MLTTTDHDRNSAGLKYVYPVLSRRAGGLSIGINLNTDNRCNWRCVYCQVPDLKRGSAPVVDMAVLETELTRFLDGVVSGQFFDDHNVPLDQRVIKDIAISGNGEPTSATEFDQVVTLIKSHMLTFDLIDKIKLVLITNGSFIQRPHVQKGLQTMDGLNAEIWFKIDSVTSAGMRRINQVNRSEDSLFANLDRACRLAPTWVQSCFFAQHNTPPSEEEIAAYLNFLRSALERNTPLKGVLLYGLARPSMQAEAPELNALPESWMQAVADRIRALNIPVNLSI